MDVDGGGDIALIQVDAVTLYTAVIAGMALG